MVPHLIPSTLQTPTQLEVSLRALFVELTGSSTETCCSTELDITKYIPYWVIQEKEDKGGDVLTIFDFIQKYYDWLYCSDSCGGSDYELESKLLNLIDIDKTKEKFFKKIFFSYFGDYDESEKVTNISGELITNATVAEFVKGIKIKFNTKKGSLGGLHLFFEKLFSVSANNIDIFYPKKELLRLNGGSFHDSRFSFDDGSHNDINSETSVLNHARIQDSDWFHDYSYVLRTGLSADNYTKFYIRTLHPLGIKCIFEQSLDTYLPPGSTFEGEVLVCESPILDNYSGYVLNETYTSGTPEYTHNIGGATYYGLTYSVGCSLGSTFGSTPSFLFPSWADYTSYSRFFDIPISKMFALCYINIATINPNEVIPENCP